MDAPALIERYGYLAILLGTCFEGEAVLLIGGYVARTGQLSIEWVLIFGALGVFVSDWSCFLAGRFLSAALLRRFPRLKQRVQRPLALIEQNQVLLILLFQFLPGSSTVTPIALGTSSVKTWRFGLLNICGIILWTAIFGMSGYAFGAALGLIILDIHMQDKILLIALLILMVILFWRHSIRRPAEGDG